MTANPMKRRYRIIDGSHKTHYRTTHSHLRAAELYARKVSGDPLVTVKRISGEPKQDGFFTWTSRTDKASIGVSVS
jgi:hypothetical protein